MAGGKPIGSLFVQARKSWYHDASLGDLKGLTD
jgi:hypothetical protein